VKATTYRDPFSGREILAIQAGDLTVGVSYDPRKTTPPVPFSSECPHCRRGQRGEAGMHARRQVQFLLSAKKRKRRAARGTKTETVFSLPPSSRPMKVTYWKERRNHHVSVTRQKPRGVLRIVASPTIVGRGQLLTYDGDRRLFQGSILRRVVRFLLSNRPTSKQQAVSCVLPLFGLPVPSRGHPRKCRTIDWREIIGETV